MPKRHWSCCALHSLPAKLPMKCDCGGFTDGKKPTKRRFYGVSSLYAAVENFVQLWTYRIYWKRETDASLLRFLSEVARHTRIGRRLRHKRACAARRT